MRGRSILYLNVLPFRKIGFLKMEKINWSPEYSVGVGVIDEINDRNYAITPHYE
jgi:hypothetical protein